MYQRIVIHRVLDYVFPHAYLLLYLCTYFSTYSLNTFERLSNTWWIQNDDVKQRNTSAGEAYCRCIGWYFANTKVDTFFEYCMKNDPLQHEKRPPVGGINLVHALKRAEALGASWRADWDHGWGNGDCHKSRKGTPRSRGGYGLTAASSTLPYLDCLL